MYVCKSMANMTQKCRFSNNQRWIFILTMLLSVACKNNRLEVNVSNIQVTPVVHRFDRELFTANPNHFETELTPVYQRDTMFFNTYADVILAYQRFNPVYNRFDSLRSFVQHPVIKKLYAAVAQKYGDFRPVEMELIEALKHFKYYFPELPIPTFTTIIDEVGTKVRLFPNTIVLSLDHFLGEDFDGYKVIPELNTYQIKRMRQEYLVPTLMYALYHYSFEQQQTQRSFLAAMIEEGKVQYFMDAMQPDIPDTIKREYTEKQLNFCLDNQKEIWNHFASKKLFFNGNEQDYRRYMTDGPFTIAPDVPASSAPRLGIYVGWEIVRHYMDNHPEISLISLIHEKDYQKILRESRYHPN